MKSAWCGYGATAAVSSRSFTPNKQQAAYAGSGWRPQVWKRAAAEEEGAGAEPQHEENEWGIEVGFQRCHAYFGMCGMGVCARPCAPCGRVQPLIRPFPFLRTLIQPPKQVCASSDPTTAGAAAGCGGCGDEDDQEEGEEEDADPVLLSSSLASSQGAAGGGGNKPKYRYDRYEGGGKSPGPLRVVNEDGSETPLVSGVDASGGGVAGGYVDVGGGGQSVEDLAAQLSSLQSFQM